MNKKRVQTKSAQSPKSRVERFFVGNNQQKITEKFGSSIRARRKQLKMTQADLADSAKLNRSYLSELERGLVSISLERAAKLADALEIALSELIK